MHDTIQKYNINKISFNHDVDKTIQFVAMSDLHTGVECGEVGITGGGGGGKLRVAVVSRGVGGRAAFSCQPGWGLRGPQETLCLPNGEWALPFPTCIGLCF